MNTEAVENISPLILAYVGDCALELLVREKLALSGNSHPGQVNKMALDYVTAKSQCVACERIKPYLSQQEADIYRRGKNAKSNSKPRNVTIYEYRKATGFEAVFGYNWLKGDHDRNRVLFELAYQKD